MAFPRTDTISPMETRKNIAGSYDRLTTLIHLPDVCVDGSTVMDSVGTYLEYAHHCLGVMHSKDHEAALERFANSLTKVHESEHKKASLTTVVRTLASELENLDPFWLYKRQGDNWLVFRIAEGQYDETMAIVETEGLALKVLDLFGLNDNPRPISVKFDSLPDGFRIEAGSDDDWDLYRTLEADDDEDEPTEEWFATVNTEYMAQILCERIMGYHV